uniref:Uncharacterized protein n=1 Tax=Arundo donax TaxID=35708 RepID=A0A0A9HID1_ARUDO
MQIYPFNNQMRNCFYSLKLDMTVDHTIDTSKHLE